MIINVVITYLSMDQLPDLPRREEAGYAPAFAADRWWQRWL